MRRTVAACVASVVAVLFASVAIPQTAFPTRAVKIVVPFPGGGGNDILARIVGDKLQARWGQPIVVENKTGAGGNIGADLAYQSEPDGYTLLLEPARAARHQSEPLQAALLQAAGVRAADGGRLGAERRDRAQGAAGQFAQGVRSTTSRRAPARSRSGQPGQRRHPAPHRHDVPER